MQVRCSILLLFLLTATPFRAVPAEDTHSLEQRLAQQFDYDDPKGSEARLLVMANQAEAAQDLTSLAEILTQVARAQVLQGHVDEASQTLDRAAALSTESVRPRIRILIERGRLLRRQGHLDTARVNFEKAYKTAMAGGQPGLAADAAHMLALMVPFEEARLWTDRGMILAERSSDPTVHHWVGILMNNWGERLDETGDHEAAALAFARALAARRLESDASVTRESEFALAVQLRKLGQSEQALAIQERLEYEATTARGPVGEILIEKIENLRALKRDNEAREAVTDALHSASKQGLSAEQIEKLHSLLKALSGQGSE
jgi:tetratricopeptide (TPR) repeat protein